MSQSPQSLNDKSGIAGYQAAWNALNTLLSRGGSLSGRERNCVFLNCRTEDVRFANASAVSGFDFPDDARGIALTDWDHDGDIDLWVNNRTSPRLRFLRNERKRTNDFVAFHLEGTESNRDGIGARVEVRLKKSGLPLTNSLRAGDGYLSQSSKWLHFGLGRGAAIEGVSVDWPGGENEEFRGVEPGRHYMLRQGKGRATGWQRPGGKAVLESSKNPSRAGGAVAQIFLPRPVPLPEINYRSGSSEKTLATNGQPLLLLLYASWCPNCVIELKELTENAEKLGSVGLDVLALAVDGLETDGAQDSIAQADELMQRIGFPFQTGHAAHTTLEKLGHVQDVLFEIRSEFAVPLGFLMDGDRNLIAIYRGPAQLETLLYDVNRISRGEAEMRDIAIPFPGKWYTLHPERPALLELLADHFQQQQLPNDSIHYLEMSLSELNHAAAANHVRGRLAGLQYKLGSNALAAKLNAEAESRFRETLKHRPHYAPAHHNLGVALYAQGKLQESEASLLRALELSPGNSRVLQNLDIVRKALK